MCATHGRAKISPVTLNMTRLETAERSSLIAVDRYRVALDLTPGDLTGAGDELFATTTTVTFTATSGSATWIDLVDADVHAITLNGVSLDPATYANNRIPLPDLRETNELTIVAAGRYTNTGEGLHRFVDPVDGEVYLYTQFETADSRRMYASFEQPDLKAEFELSVVAPSHWQVLSNSPSPEPVYVREGVCRWDFAPTARMSTYITALVAGPYTGFHDTYTGSFGTYPLGVFCRSSLAQFLDVDEILTVTKQGFAFFEEAFGVGYPFVKYDQIFAAEYNWGAMENAGCVTINEEAYLFRSRVTHSAYEQRANTILHELAHMWFGNLVTMQWWEDLWLNESFAEWAAFYASAAATRYTDAWPNFLNLRKSWAYRQDQLPSTHPISADMPDLDSVRVNFDGISYAKGASALRQLIAWVGEEEFLKALNAYFTKHAWGNTQLSDLFDELEAASGRDLSGWAQEWLRNSGVNLLRANFALDSDGNYANFAIDQEPPSTPPGLAPTLRSHRLRLGLYDLVDGSLVRRDQIELDVTGATTVVDQLVGVRQPDLLLINDDDLTFAKIRLDDRSWATARDHLGSLSDPLARGLLWMAAWDMTRDAEVPAGDYVRLVLGAIEHESDIALVQVALRQAKSAIDQFSAPEHINDYNDLFASALHEWLMNAVPGSDHQLAFMRIFISAASSDEHLQTLENVLDGSRVIEGLSMDHEMRWQILGRLVATGRAGTTAIDAELHSDPTATGKRTASMLRAAMPTPEAKETAWREAFAQTDLPNSTLDAVMAGFQQPDQLDLIRPYRDRYFAEVRDMWALRTPEMAQDVCARLYPFLVIEQETVDATDVFLSADDLNPAMRRFISEGRDGMARALRCRATDAAS